MAKICNTCRDIELRKGAETCMRCGGHLAEVTS